LIVIVSVQLDSPLHFSQNVKRIALWKNPPLRKVRKVDVLGWGYTTPSGKLFTKCFKLKTVFSFFIAVYLGPWSRQLRGFTTTLLPQRQCRRQPTSQICVRNGPTTGACSVNMNRWILNSFS